MNQIIFSCLTSCLNFLTTLQKYFFFHYLYVAKFRFLNQRFNLQMCERKMLHFTPFLRVIIISAVFSMIGSVSKLFCTVWIDWLFLRRPQVFCGKVNIDNCLLLRLLFHLFVFSSIVVQTLHFSSSCEKSSDEKATFSYCFLQQIYSNVHHFFHVS